MDFDNCLDYLQKKLKENLTEDMLKPSFDEYGRATDTQAKRTLLEELFGKLSFYIKPDETPPAWQVHWYFYQCNAYGNNGKVRIGLSIDNDGFQLVTFSKVHGSNFQVKYDELEISFSNFFLNPAVKINEIAVFLERAIKYANRLNPNETF